MDNDITLMVYLFYLTGYADGIEAFRSQVFVALVVSRNYQNDSLAYREALVSGIPSHLIDIEIYIRVRREYHVINRYYDHCFLLFSPFRV